MSEKKQIKRKLINLQNTFGKVRGLAAWKLWKEEKKKVKTNG
jgi:hypothetical protein